MTASAGPAGLRHDRTNGAPLVPPQQWSTRMAVFAKPVKRLARAAGVSRTRHPAPNTLERHLKDVIRQLRINCVLDVGAHEGAYARRLRGEVGFTGHIASFEPAGRSYARLVASRKGDQGWRGYRYALGRE